MASIQERRTTPPVFRDANELHEGRLSQAAFEIPGTEARWLAANAVHRNRRPSRFRYRGEVAGRQRRSSQLTAFVIPRTPGTP